MRMHMVRSQSAGAERSAGRRRARVAPQVRFVATLKHGFGATFLANVIVGPLARQNGRVRRCSSGSRPLASGCKPGVVVAAQGPSYFADKSLRIKAFCETMCADTMLAGAQVRRVAARHRPTRALSHRRCTRPLASAASGQTLRCGASRRPGLRARTRASAPCLIATGPAAPPLSCTRAGGPACRTRFSSTLSASAALSTSAWAR